MNAAEEAKTRRIEAFVGAAFAPSDAAQLEARTLLLLRSAPPPTPRRMQWLAAAVLLAGMAVVASVAWLQQRSDFAASAQDPKTDGALAVVDAARLPPTLRVDVTAGSDLPSEILRIAELARCSVVVGRGVAGPARRALTAKPWREAIAALASQQDAGVEELDGILMVHADARRLPFETHLTLAADALSLRDFVRAVALRCGVDVVVASNLHGRVRCNLKDASWRDALDAAARQLGGEVIGCGSVLALRRHAETSATGKSVAFARTSIGSIVDDLAHRFGRNVVIAPGFGDAAARLDNAPADSFLRALARAGGGTYRREGSIDRLDMGPVRERPSAVLTAEDVDLHTFAELVRSAVGVAVAIPPAADQRVSVFASHAPLPDLVAAVALATGHRAVDRSDGLGIE